MNNTETRRLKKYTCQEVVWFKTIEKLRKYGVALQTIKLTKYLFFNSVKFELFNGTNDYYLIIYVDKAKDIHSEDKLLVDLLFDENEKLIKTIIDKYADTTYIKVGVYKIFNECKSIMKK